MIRSPGAAGFNGRSAPVASSRLIDAVAASLAIGSLSLCLIVTLTVLSIQVSVAMPAFWSKLFSANSPFSRDTTRGPASRSGSDEDTCGTCYRGADGRDPARGIALDRDGDA